MRNSIPGVLMPENTADVDDPVAHVLSANLHRRHLTPSQKSMVGDKARELFDKRAKERQKRKPKSVVVELPPQKKSKSRDQAGKAVGVSGTLMDRARKVAEKGVPELAKAVEEGRMSVTTAAEFADAGEDVQRQAAAEARVSGGRWAGCSSRRQDAAGGRPDPSLWQRRNKSEKWAYTSHFPHISM